MKTNIYFEPPSRLQLLDKLKHLIRFSDFLLLVSGGRGSGKSTLLAQLKPDSSDTTLACCVVKPESEIAPLPLLQQLSAQLPSHEEPGRDISSLLTAFHNQLKSMHDAGRKCLILVDDAEYLSDEALALLLNLHAAEAQLVLVSDLDYAQAVMSNQTVKHMEGRVHQIAIEGMTEEESLDYLQLCHPAVTSLPDRKKAELIRLAEGMPGRIESLLAGGKVAPSYTQKKRTAFPLPPMHMAGIGVVLLAIVAVSLVQFMPDEPIVEDTATIERVSVPLPVVASSGDDAEPAALVNVAVPSKVEQEMEEPVEAPMMSVKTELANRLKAQEEKLEAESKALKPVRVTQAEVKQKVDTVQVLQTSSTEKQKTQQHARQLEQDLRSIVASGSTNTERLKNAAASKQDQSPGTVAAVTNTTSETASKTPVTVQSVGTKQDSTDETRLLGFAPTSYTLQLLGARSKESATEFIRKHGGGSQFYYFSTVYKGAPWHVVVYGNYANRDVANASIRKLPAALQKTNPWARSLQGVQLDIKKKK